MAEREWFYSLTLLEESRFILESKSVCNFAACFFRRSVSLPMSTMSASGK